MPAPIYSRKALRSVIASLKGYSTGKPFECDKHDVCEVILFLSERMDQAVEVVEAEFKLN